jgi:hypothetical protein
MAGIALLVDILNSDVSPTQTGSLEKFPSEKSSKTCALRWCNVMVKKITLNKL